jgi:hypothetical protein
MQYIGLRVLVFVGILQALLRFSLLIATLLHYIYITYLA